MKSLKDEISYQTSLAADLPEIETFQSKIDGIEVTFTKEVNGVKFSVSVNANEKLLPEIMSGDGMEGMDNMEGMDSMDKGLMDNEDSDDKEDESIFLPVININIGKPSGHRLEVDCSFNPEGESLQDIIESGLQINEVRVVSPGTSEKDDVYSLEGTNFDDNIYDSLVEYMEENGIDDNFLNQLVQYYQVFERRIYLSEFLYKLNNFIKS